MLQSLEILPLLWWMSWICSCARAGRVKITNPPPTTICFLKKEKIQCVWVFQVWDDYFSHYTAEGTEAGKLAIFPRLQGKQDPEMPCELSSCSVIGSSAGATCSWAMASASTGSLWEGKEEPESSERLLWPKVSVELTLWTSKIPSTNEVRPK